MPLTLNIPVTNTLSWPIRLYNGAVGGNPVAALAAGASTAFNNLTFDRIQIITPTLPHHVYVQNPNVAALTVPGSLGYFRTGPNIGGQTTYVLTVGQPNRNATTYSFR